jgi:oligogalacturonide transport system substrate-binding protein
MEGNKMDKKLKLANFLCISVLILSMLTGCAVAPISTGQTGVSDAGQNKETVNLRFAWWGGDTRHQATIAAIDAYMAKNSHVTIDAEYMAWDGYQKRLITQIAGGLAPDIFQNSPAWFNDIGGEYYEDLSKHGDVLDLTQFNQALIDECIHDGKLRALPAGVLANALLYNKDFFAKYGIPEDTVWTWDKILEIGQQVHEKDPNVYLLPSTELDIINRLIAYPYLSQKTGDIWISDDYEVLFDRDILVETLTYIDKLFSTGTMQPLSITTTTGQTDPKIVRGEIGMFILLTSNIGATVALNPNANYGIAEVPMHPDAKQSANPVRASVVYSINPETKAMDESLKFMNWILNDPDAAMILLEERGTPASDIARKTLNDNGKMMPEIAKAMELANQKPGKIPNIPSENAEIWQINKDVITKLALDKITPEDGADEILNNYKTKLAELKEANTKK